MAGSAPSSFHPQRIHISIRWWEVKHMASTGGRGDYAKCPDCKFLYDDIIRGLGKNCVEIIRKQPVCPREILFKTKLKKKKSCSSLGWNIWNSPIHPRISSSEVVGTLTAESSKFLLRQVEQRYMGISRGCLSHWAICYSGRSGTFSPSISLS